MCKNYSLLQQGRRNRGRGGDYPSLYFVRYVNPISTRGADYVYHITTCPPFDLQTFLRPWLDATWLYGFMFLALLLIFFWDVYHLIITGVRRSWNFFTRKRGQRYIRTVASLYNNLSAISSLSRISSFLNWLQWSQNIYEFEFKVSNFIY